MYSSCAPVNPDVMVSGGDRCSVARRARTALFCDGAPIRVSRYYGCGKDGAERDEAGEDECWKRWASEKGGSEKRRPPCDAFAMWACLQRGCAAREARLRGQHVCARGALAHGTRLCTGCAGARSGGDHAAGRGEASPLCLAPLPRRFPLPFSLVVFSRPPFCRS
jgi:hypothetical protein